MHTLRDDEQAVSPVIGVILMVAITVLLAATAATFIFGLSEDRTDQTVVNAAFEANYEPGSSDTLEFGVQSTKQNLRAGDLMVVVDGASPNSVNQRYDVESFGAFGADSSLSAGTSIEVSKTTLGVGTDIDLSDATVKLVWQESGTSQSTTLTEWTS